MEADQMLIKPADVVAAVDVIYKVVKHYRFIKSSRRSVGVFKRFDKSS